jgi:hypothetical protein
MSENKLTGEQVEQINEVIEESVKENKELSSIKEMPSNNGVEENEGNTEEGEMKLAQINIDPNTGEHRIIKTIEDEDTVDSQTFEELVADIESGKIKVDTDNSPITEKELKDIVELDEDGNIDFTNEEYKTLLSIVNRRQNGEDFNIYKLLPNPIKKVINETIGISEDSSIVTKEIRTIRNSMAESYIDQYIINASIARARGDLNKEMESLFKDTQQDIAEYTVGYTAERNRAYREQVEAMEDEEQKEKLLKILDTIDSAYSLDPLKEFAKNCKIKKYDLENPKNYFRDFINKYSKSEYNIYDIKLTLPILERKIVDNEKYNNADVVAFLVCFCKYIRNFNSDNIVEHSFMYYVIYNIVLMDANTSEKTIEVSNIFANNIKEVMDNLKERNDILK